MKTTIGFPKYTKIAWLTAGILLVACGAVQLLALCGVYLYLPQVSTPELTVLFLLFFILLFASGLLVWAAHRKRRKWFKLLIILLTILATYLALFFVLALAVFTAWNPYFTFVSPDKQHKIVICEQTLLTNGGGPVFEKTSLCTMRQIGSYVTPDADRPFTTEDYRILWQEDGFELQYLFKNPYLTEDNQPLHQSVTLEYLDQ